MRARKFMSEVLLDQIPNLSELQRFLDQLAISAPPESGQLHLHRLLRRFCTLYRRSFHRVFTASSALLVSHVPVLRENIMKTTKWPEVSAWNSLRKSYELHSFAAGNRSFPSSHLRHQRRRKKARTQRYRRRVRHQRPFVAAFYTLLSSLQVRPKQLRGVHGRPQVQVKLHACRSAIVTITLPPSACGKPAEKRCSRCKLEWYCGRCGACPRYVSFGCAVAVCDDHR